MEHCQFENIVNQRVKLLSVKFAKFELMEF